MNKIEKQILENQLSIINCLNYIMVYTQAEGSGDLQRDNINCFEKTKKILNPTTKQEDCCEMEKDAEMDIGESK